MAQGSGELIFWPYSIAKYGLTFLVLLAPACLLQFPLVFEIGRYTLLTGEGVFKGFFRLSRPFGIFLWLLFTISFLWFGAFATAGGTAMAALTNFPNDSLWTPGNFAATPESPLWWTRQAQTLFWAQSSIIVFTVAILWAKSVYRLIEFVLKLVAMVSLVGMTVACLHPDVRAQILPFLKGMFTIDVAAMRGLDVKADAGPMLTAVTYVGLGGFWTLFYSYWMREKGVAMASYAERITGFRSAVQPIRITQPALPAADPDAPRQLRRWYRYLSLETLVGIVGNLITTLMMCLLAFALLYPQGLVPKDFDIAVVQARFFENAWGDFGRVLFLFIAAAFLADTWLATADCVSRIHLDALTAIFPRIARHDQRRWYYGLVLAIAVVTSITMYLDQPMGLLVTSAIIGFAGTVIYSTALIFVNHFTLGRRLAPELRPSRVSLAAIAFTTLCYFALAAAYLDLQIPVWYHHLAGSGE